MSGEPIAAGPLAEEMARLGWQMTWLGGAVFVLVVVLLVVGAFRKPKDGTDRNRIMRNWVVGGGVILPVLLVSAVFVLTLIAMRATSLEASDEAVAIEVVGNQWWWEVSYPDDGIVTANEIHLPVGRPVELRLTSDDVIHSFWIPELGGKIDMLPEDVNTFVIQADEAGVFDGACAEFCGLQHARMRFVAVAGTDDEYRDWLENEATEAVEPQAEQTRRGLEVFTNQGCGDCHTIRGTDAGGQEGPDLTHVAGRRTLGAGTLEHTPENLREWISDPHQFKDGVAMPAFDLSDEAMDALVAYLESLE